jgi:hypothetical protein
VHERFSLQLDDGVMSDADDQFLQARSDVYWCRLRLEQAESRAEGNFSGWVTSLDKLRDALRRAEARWAHIEAKRDAAFGGVK